MPGLVAFRRRWSVGSDDMVIPGLFLFLMHAVWSVLLTVLLFLVEFDRSKECVQLLWGFVVGYLVILGLSMVVELSIAIIAMRGTVLDTTPRAAMQYVLYFRLTVMLIEAGWLSAGIVWLYYYYNDCPIENAKESVLVLVIFNWCVLLSVVITVWCTYDAAGRSWVKMKQYQKSIRESRHPYRRSNSTRNWRQRKVVRAYQDKWQQRCKFLFCCYSGSDRNKNSFADIAQLLSDFFRDLDVVPSDVIVGLVLLRKFQKIEQKAIVEQKINDTYEFLSGVPITPRTQFLSLRDENDMELILTVIHYAHYAVHAYGWPMYIVKNKLGLCKLCSNLSCCSCMPCVGTDAAGPEIIDDNCCRCNYAVLKKLMDQGDIEIVYATYHCDIGATPFFIALDYDRKKVVISIRGTLSMQDVLTDLNAEGETIPLTPIKEDWYGHKGMVQAAQYIYNHLIEGNLVEKALNHNPEKGTDAFKLVIVGHSLGAGTASILGILMRQIYEDLECFCYAPPGGLLSMPAVEYSKCFTTSVVVGKDVVPRIGLNQMEALRADLITAIKRSVDPKWKTITCSLICCGCVQPTSVVEMNNGDSPIHEYAASKKRARSQSLHPNDDTIALTSHQPLYPPGKIIHVVRHHVSKVEKAFSKHSPVYQALWAENTDFDEVLISPVMIQDHMPDRVLEALQKVVTTFGPRKPQRNPSISPPTITTENEQPPTISVYLETSFTSVRPASEPNRSNGSSVTNGYHSIKSQASPIPINHVLSMLGNDQISDFNINMSTPPKHPKKSMSLNIRNTSSIDKVDLINDDWFGHAPLASPESLSELSLISSRVSLALSEKSGNGSDKLDCPTSMRRSFKIMGNLSQCAEDASYLKTFEKTKNLLRKSSSSSSNNNSYVSAQNDDMTSPIRNVSEQVSSDNFNSDYGQASTSCELDKFESAEDILDNVMSTAGCKEFFNSNPAFVETHFDFFEGEKIQSDSPKFCRLVYQSTPQLLSPSEEIDADLLSNLAIDLNLAQSNRSMQVYSSKSNSVDSGSQCRTPDSKNVTFNPQVIKIESSTVHERHKKKDRWHILPFRTKSASIPKIKFDLDGTSPKTEVERPSILVPKRRKSQSEDEFFARTEGLPLLSGLASSMSDSPGYVRKKNHVFPADIAVMTKSKSKESNV